MKLFSVPVLILSLFFTLYCLPAIAQQSYKSVLLKAVQHLPLPDSSHVIFSLLTFNDTVENIAVSNLDTELPIKVNVIVAAPLGKGKIIAFGSSAYLHKGLLDDTNVLQLIQNMFAWASNGHKHPQMGIYTHADSAFLQLADQHHISTYPISSKGIKKYTDIIYLETDIRDKDTLRALETFVRNGGTLIQVSPYEQIYYKMLASPGSFAQDAGINTLLVKAGIYDINMAFFSSHQNNRLITDSVPDYLRLSAIPSLLKRPSTGFIDDITDRYIIQPTVDLLFENNDINSPVLQTLKAQYKVPDTLTIPTPQNPVVLSTAEEKARYHLSRRFYEKTRSSTDDKHQIAPGARYFPGAVPDTATRVTTSITVPVQVGTQGLLEPNPIYLRPHSTGLYVPPGEEVKVVLQSKDKEKHLKAQIGVHNDDLADLTQLTRSAENMVRIFPLDQDTTVIYSPFGGLLQLNISDTTSLKEITINVEGAVKAPCFKLGQTSESSWIAGIRNNPAPWAELATDKIILTVPAYRIRHLDNPVKLLQFWDEVMDADADLARISRTRPHPERVVVDQDVAYGYMYTVPERIIVPDDESCALMLDEVMVRTNGSWGLFHELGHRHQFWGIDFGELQEVSVNLFTMHVYDKVLHKGIYNHENIASKDIVLKNISNYLQNNPSFEKWGQDPFLALCMYIELIQQFGWQCIADTYAKFRATPKEKYPQSQEDKRDLWFLTICEVTKTNLTGFFDIWKVPVSAQVKEKVVVYPSWLPDELKQYDGHNAPVK
ncbi:Peptidase M60, enhancin and enhancin-like [Chitinophaga sp. YR627]|uniref:M60 family metallopeptidase n=1 Tax=Chitinophaga sp. YR627 TaxID=1881041 RepID=UPI0008F3044D|nr:M60 family metallopeptidase [Chitinophaga sp. YR627]SFO74915.1 Peptidase M60, enhancin and enhancin-like [Chitinophaga sp. YR627]